MRFISLLLLKVLFDQIILFYKEFNKELKYNKVYFNSKICRLVYELMQSTNDDYPHKLQSVDDSYYYYIQGWFVSNNQQALLNHQPRNKDEIELKIGDIISIPGTGNPDRKTNLLNGYSLGKNLRTVQTGLYPSYKTFETVSSDSRWNLSVRDKF